MTSADRAYQILGPDLGAASVISCDHASNHVPKNVGGGTLGVPHADMNRHIGYDVGAAAVSRYLGESLNAPVILSNFSRLVIDPNRGEDDPTLIMQLYDGTLIPGNRHVSDDERHARLTSCYRPYHAALDRLLDARANPVLIAIHSFTPRLNGHANRPWHIGVLHNHDHALAPHLIARLRAEKDLCIGENEPYAGHLKGDSIDRHAIKRNIPNTLIEIRNDLIQTDSDQRAWARRLAPILQEVMAIAT